MLIYLLYTWHYELSVLTCADKEVIEDMLNDSSFYSSHFDVSNIIDVCFLFYVFIGAKLTMETTCQCLVCIAYS